MTDSEKLDLILSRLDKIEQRTANIEQRTANIEQRTANIEQRTANIEQRTTNIEQRTTNIEQRTANIEERTTNIETSVLDMKLTLENEIRVNIQRVAEGHLDLSRNLHEALKIESEKEMLAIRVGVLETELRRIKSQLGIA